MNAGHFVKDLLYLLNGQHDREPALMPGSNCINHILNILVQYVRVNKNNGIQSLTLGGGRDPSFNRKMCKEILEVHAFELPGTFRFDKSLELSEPDDVGLFGA